MYRDNMKQEEGVRKRKLVKIAETLEISKHQIEKILQQTSTRKEKPSFLLGPYGYSGGYYGTVSINEFKEI